MKYLIAVRIKDDEINKPEIFEFKTKKDRASFIAELKNKNEFEYMTSETEK